MEIKTKIGKKIKNEVLIRLYAEYLKDISEIIIRIKEKLNRYILVLL
tara:strand:+ start:248 stop:388 length:141 start_codon:yes stop_codon:yes gene_type:complete